MARSDEGSGGLPIDENDAFFDDAASADDDGTGDGKDGRLGMNYGTCADGNVTLELDILAHDGF